MCIRDSSQQLKPCIRMLSFEPSKTPQQKFMILHIHETTYVKNIECFISHIAFLYDTSPVSYTHLDVYKRQDTYWLRSFSNSRNAIENPPDVNANVETTVIIEYHELYRLTIPIWSVVIILVKIGVVMIARPRVNTVANKYTCLLYTSYRDTGLSTLSSVE